MTTPQTPGQVAYESAWRIHEELYPKAHRTPWRELHPAHKRGWEAAAQAVLEAFVSSARPVTLHLDEETP